MIKPCDYWDDCKIQPNNQKKKKKRKRKENSKIRLCGVFIYDFKAWPYKLQQLINITEGNLISAMNEILKKYTKFWESCKQM